MMVPQKLTAQLAHARAALFRHTLTTANAQGQGSSSHSTTSAILPYFQKSSSASNNSQSHDLAGSASTSASASASSAGGKTTSSSSYGYSRTLSQVNQHTLHIDSSSINSALGVSRGDDRNDDDRLEGQSVSTSTGGGVRLLRRRPLLRRRRWSSAGVEANARSSVGVVEAMTLPQVLHSSPAIAFHTASSGRQLHTISTAFPRAPQADESIGTHGHSLADESFLTAAQPSHAKALTQEPPSSPPTASIQKADPPTADSDSKPAHSDLSDLSQVQTAGPTQERTRRGPVGGQASPASPRAPSKRHATVAANGEGMTHAGQVEVKEARALLARSKADIALIRRTLDSWAASHIHLPSTELHGLVRAALKTNIQYYKDVHQLFRWVRSHGLKTDRESGQLLVLAVCRRIEYICDSIAILSLRASSSFLTPAARDEIETKLEALNLEKEDLANEIAYLVRSTQPTAVLTLSYWSALVHAACRVMHGKDAQTAVRTVIGKLSSEDDRDKIIAKSSSRTQKSFWSSVMRSFAVIGDVLGIKDAKQMRLEICDSEAERAYIEIMAGRYVVQGHLNAGRTLEALEELEVFFEAENALLANAKALLEFTNGPHGKNLLHLKTDLLANVAEAFARHDDLERSLEWLEEIEERKATDEKTAETYLHVLAALAKSRNWNDHLMELNLERLEQVTIKLSNFAGNPIHLAKLNFVLERLAQEAALNPSEEMRLRVLEQLRTFTRSLDKWGALLVLYPSTVKALSQSLPRIASSEPWTDIAVTLLWLYGQRKWQMPPSSWTSEQESVLDNIDLVRKAETLEMTLIQFVKLYPLLVRESDIESLKPLDLRLIKLFRDDRTPNTAATLNSEGIAFVSEAILRLAEGGHEKEDLRRTFEDLHGTAFTEPQGFAGFLGDYIYRARLVFGVPDPPKKRLSQADSTVEVDVEQVTTPNSSSSKQTDNVPSLIFDENLALRAQPAKYSSDQEIHRIYEVVKSGIAEGKHPGLGPLLELVKRAARMSDTSRVKQLHQWMLRIVDLETEMGIKRMSEVQICKTVAQALGECGDLVQSRALRDRILSMGESVPADIYGTWIVKITGTPDEAGAALAIYEEAKSAPLMPTLYFYNTLISRLAKARQVDRAITIFREMQATGIAPSKVTYGALISGCCRIGDLESADFLLREMLTSVESVRNSAPPFNSIIQAYIALGDRDACLKYLTLMRDHRVVFNSHTHRLVIEVHSCLPPIQNEWAREWLNRTLQNTSIEVTARHCIPFIRSHGILLNDLSAAIKAFQDIPEILRREQRQGYDALSSKASGLDAESYEALFEVFMHHGRHDLVEKFYADMKATKIQSTPYVANVLIKSRAANDNLAGARAIFDSMLDEPLDRSPSSHKVDRRTGLPSRQPSTYEAMIQAERAQAEPDTARIDHILYSMSMHGYPEAVRQRIEGLARYGKVDEPETIAHRPLGLRQTGSVPQIHASPMSTSARTKREMAPQEPVNVSHSTIAPVGDQPKMADTPAPPPAPGTGPRSAANRGTKFKAKKAAMTLTPRALDRLRSLLDSPTPKLIRVGVRNKGCAGMSYHLEYTDEPGKFDEVVEQDGVKVLIDSKALFSIIGSEMDYVEDRLSQGFRFWNPQVADECGCGSSFALRERPSMEASSVDQP